MRVSKLLTVLLTLLVVFGLSFQAMAGNPEKKGTAGADELLIPMGARGIALAGACVANISGIDAIYWNPAGVAASDKSIEATFSYMKYIADINVNFGGFVTKTPVGSIGFTFQSIGFGDIPITTEDSPEGIGAFYSPTYMTIGVTYSRAMTDRIFIGVNAKFVSETIMQTNASTVAIDMGVQYLTESGIRLGVALKNFGNPISFEGANMDRQVELPDTKPGTPQRRLRIPGQDHELPSSFEIGLAYELQPMEKANVSLMGAFRHHNFLNDQMVGGVEISYDNMFFIRGGYDYGMDEGTDVAGGDTYLYGPNFGFGILYPLTGTMNVGFDFAYRTTASYFDNNMYFTLKLLF